MDKLATIILNYNGRSFIQKFLPDVVKYNEGFPVYVVDNNSTDQSVSLLESDFKEKVSCIKLDKNYGFCGGYNKAADMIEAEYFVLLNSDVEVTSGWLLPLLSLMETDRNIAACQPKILDHEQKDLYEYAGAGGGYIDILGYPFCRGRIFRSIETDYHQYNDITQVFWASGACMMIRSEIFKEMGGFDEDYFAHMEEIDLCWRMKKSGYQIFYNGQSEVYHVGGGTLNQSNPYKTYLNFRNSLITLIKNESPVAVWWKVPARILLDIIASIKFLLMDTINDGLAVIRADIHVLSRLLYYRRKKVKYARKVSLDSGLYRKSIVFSHYILHKRFFFNLRSIIPDHVVPPS